MRTRNRTLIKKIDELFQSLLHKELNPIRDSKHSNGVNSTGKNLEVKKLSEVGEIIIGTTSSTRNREYRNGEFLWTTPTDIKENTFIFTDTPKKLNREGCERTRSVSKMQFL